MVLLHIHTLPTHMFNRTLLFGICRARTGDGGGGGWVVVRLPPMQSMIDIPVHRVACFESALCQF
jgi:hypothetical protein